MNKIGLTFSGQLTIPEVIKYARIAEKKGFYSFWAAEQRGLRDSITTAAALAASTTSPLLGLGVISPYTRHPVLTASTCASLDELSNKRLIIGFGASKRFWQALGINDSSPINTMKECIEVVRRILKGENLTYQGKAFRIDKMGLSFTPPRTTIPIFIGAMSRKMIETAGEIGDGVLLGNLSAPEHTRFAVERVETGARRVGKDPALVEIAGYVTVWTTDNEPSARVAAKKQLAVFLANPGWEILFGPEKAQNPLVQEICHAARQGQLDKAASLVNNELLDTVTISGSPRACRDRLSEYTSAGLTTAIIRTTESSLSSVINALGDSN